MQTSIPDFHMSEKEVILIIYDLIGNQKYSTIKADIVSEISKSKCAFPSALGLLVPISTTLPTAMAELTIFLSKGELVPNKQALSIAV